MKARRSTSKTTPLLKPIETNRQFALRLAKGFSIAGVLILLSVCFLPLRGTENSAPWGLTVISLVGFTGLLMLSAILDERAKQLGHYFSYLGLTIRNVMKLLALLFIFVLVGIILSNSSNTPPKYTPADYGPSVPY